ncbi:MAG TPA: response regulator [Thermoanaerobaculia bacterium]|nr:response regulator [Thermoanaerobaculia bacterium]
MDLPDEHTAVAPLDTGGCLRVLVVDVDGKVTSLLTTAFEGSAERERFDLARASGLTETLERVAAGDVDVVLLPISPPSQELGSLVTLRAEAPSLPIVVLCASADEALAVKAVQLGASDYLVAERLYGTLAARSLRHAVEAARVRAVLARHHAEWPASLGGGAGSRPAPLRAAFPERFAELARDYGEILDRAVEQVLLRRPATLEPQLQKLAGDAAELRAGPRDVVELHAAVMKQREAEQGAQRMKLYLAEGRVRLLELMGHLVTLYRDRWLGGPRPGAG